MTAATLIAHQLRKLEHRLYRNQISADEAQKRYTELTTRAQRLGVYDDMRAKLALIQGRAL